MKKAKFFSSIIIVSLIFFPLLETAVFAHDNIYVHPYIAEQAFVVWPGNTNHEVYAYLGWGERDYKEWWNPIPGDSIICDDSKTGGTLDNPAGTITEGAKEEDDYDSILNVCNLDPDYLYGFFHHFYDPDVISPNGLYLPPLDRRPGALDYANEYFLRAIQLYRENSKPQAYWYLGKIAHLLADTSVPAHVNNDPHLPLNGDSYENYAKYNHFNWTFYAAKQLEDSSETSLLDKQDITLEKLFWNLAQRSQYFPSNNRFGNDDYLDVDGSSENMISGLTWFDGWETNPNSLRNILFDYISDENCYTIGAHLMPLAIQYTASLYKLFWYELHVDINMPVNIQVLNPIEFSGMGKLNGHDVNTWDSSLHQVGKPKLSFPPMR